MVVSVNGRYGNRGKGQCCLSGLQMCLSSTWLYGMELTGLKHPKTTCFRRIVQTNIQGNGSFQMLISCDCYPARGLTLFKGQVV